MEKNSTLMYRYLICLYLIFFVENSANGQVHDNASLHSVEEILHWANERYNYVGDTSSFEIYGTKYFVFCGNNFSGLIRQTIYLFEQQKEMNGIFNWTLICFRKSLVPSVRVMLDEKTQTIIFISETNKIVMSIPYESLGYQKM